MKLKQDKEKVLNKIRLRKGSHEHDLFVELLKIQLEIAKNAIIVEPNEQNIRLMQGEAKLCERLIRDIGRDASDEKTFTEAK